MPQWKMSICCDMMREMLGDHVVRLGYGRNPLIACDNTFVCGIDYCPWCGKHITLEKKEEEE